jgi:hypothetical protein
MLAVARVGGAASKNDESPSVLESTNRNRPNGLFLGCGGGFGFEILARLVFV